MYGSNPEEAVQCDIISEGIIDFKSKIKDFGDSFRDACHNYMPKFERILRSNNNGNAYLVGESISFGMYQWLTYTFTFILVLYSLLVDVQFVEYIIAARENGMSFAEWPLVDAYVTRVVALPRLAAYLASDRRYPYPGNMFFK